MNNSSNLTGMMSTSNGSLSFMDQSEFLISTIENRPLTKQSIIFAILFSFTFVFGIFTNAIVVLVFAIKSEFRQYTNYFFANLSIADILVLLTCIPVSIADLFSPDIWNFGALYCKLYFFVEYCVTSVSSLTIIIISVERFFAIASPWTVKQLFNERKSRAAIVLIWLFGLSIATPFLSMAEYTTLPDQCYLNMTKIHLIYVCVLNIMLIFVPTIGLSVLYIYIVIKLKDHYKLFVSSSPPRHSSEIGGGETVLRVHRNNSGNRNYQNQTSSVRVNAVATNGKKMRIQSEIERPPLIPDNRSCSINLERRVNCRRTAREGLPPATRTGKRSHSFHHIQTNAGAFNFEPRLRRSIHRNQNLNTSKFNFTIVISFVTLVFFCCQLPIRIFLLWSYLKHHFAPPLIQITETGEVPNNTKNDLFYINLISNLSTLIYFLHCVSNPIIYNILSIKFRKAFLNMTTFNKSRDCRISFKTTQ